MNNTENLIYLTISLRRNSFFINQNTVEKLGNPKYIQFLVNPKERTLAIMGTDEWLAGGSSNRVHPKLTKSGGVYEFFSMALLCKLADMIGLMDVRCNYRFLGEIDEQNRVAYFCADNLVRIERRCKNDKA